MTKHKSGDNRPSPKFRLTSVIIVLTLSLVISTITLLATWSDRTLAWQDFRNLIKPVKHAGFLKLSTNEIYTRHYGEASLDAIHETVRHRLAKIVSNPPPGQFPPSSVRISAGITVEKKVVTTHGYKHAEHRINALCFNNTNFVKPVCLSTLAHSFFKASGIAISPTDRKVFEISGGCCSPEWPHIINTTVELSKQSHISYKQNNRRVILVLNQHHGVTYSHVMHEVLTRYFITLPIIDAFPDLFVSISKSDVTVTILTMLGLSHSRILQSSSTSDTWTGAALLLYPQTVFLQEAQLPFGKNQSVVTADILGRVACSTLPPSKQASSSTRPLIVLIERADDRHKDGSCDESRCIKNFKELREAITERLDMEVQVFPAKEDLKTTLQLFSRAHVVVGVHGAGLQNIIFCKPGTTVVQIGARDHYKRIAEQFSLSFHFVIIEKLSLVQSENIVLDVPAVVQQIAAAVDKDRVYERVAEGS